MSNIIQKYINNIVQKYSNGTALIKGATLGAWDNPDKRLVMAIGADANGIHFKNDPNDPMPIKTINMNGLQVWEETDDYIIYLDKDAVVTTVQNYVPGTFDLYNERKNQIESHAEMLKMYEVEWTPEDSEKLLLDVNNAQLERIASTPTTMDEPTEIQTFSARAVPTTYECCFRTDKKTGEIYIGEGYENLYSFDKINVRNDAVLTKEEKEDYVLLYGVTGSSDNNFIEISQINGVLEENMTASFKIEQNEVELGNLQIYFRSELNKKIICSPNHVVESSISITVINTNQDRFYFLSQNKLSKFNIKIHYFQITKTSTPKPFVRGVMPSGKLAFVTGATSETHSFVMKQFESVRYFHCSSDYNWENETVQSDNTVSNNETPKDALISKLYAVAINNSGKNLFVKILNKGVTRGVLTLSWRRREGDKMDGTNSFKQLLIYKGNLTESELKAENAKVINVSKLDFNPLSIKRYLSNLEQFEKVQIYSPALTDEEIAVELGKNVFIPKNRDGVPSWQPKIGV